MITLNYPDWIYEYTLPTTQDFLMRLYTVDEMLPTDTEVEMVKLTFDRVFTKSDFEVSKKVFLSLVSRYLRLVRSPVRLIRLAVQFDKHITTISNIDINDIEALKKLSNQVFAMKLKILIQPHLTFLQKTLV